MPPASTRTPPNHTMARIAAFMISCVTGFSSADSRPTRMAAAVCSSVLSEKRRRSSCVRAKARITRTPERFSRRIRVSLSSLPCTVRCIGTVWRITSTMTNTNSGTAATITRESRQSMTSAMIIPPIQRKGARITRRMSIATAY